MNSANPYLKYTLPKTIDNNFHEVNLTVFNIPEFGKFENKT